MELIKKNLVSIICGVIALGMVAALILFVAPNWQSLQTKMEASAGNYHSLETLLTKPRKLPIVNPDDPTEQDMKKFPTPKIIEQGETFTKQVEAESNAMRDAAVKMNIHQPLTVGSLPLGNPVRLFDFRRDYQKYFPVLANGGGAVQAAFTPATALASQLAVDLKAGIPPTSEDIGNALALAIQKIKAEQTLLGSNHEVLNQSAVDQAIRERQQKLPEEMIHNAAKKSKVYINPDTFDPYPKIAVGGAPDPIDVFIAQMILWVQQDVVAAVNEVNAAAPDVTTAPVKHLVKVLVQPVFIRSSAGAAASGDPDGTIPKEPAVSPTGRISNGLYDVWHFTLVANVEAAKAPEFLRGLSKNRLITPFQVDIRSVDLAADLAYGVSHGYVYGDRPVINMTVQCEILFLRKWTEPLMPPKIKEMLGIQAQPAQQTASVGG